MAEVIFWLMIISSIFYHLYERTKYHKQRWLIERKAGLYGATVWARYEKKEITKEEKNRRLDEIEQQRKEEIKQLRLQAIQEIKRKNEEEKERKRKRKEEKTKKRKKST